MNTNIQCSEGTPLRIVNTKHSEKNCSHLLSVPDESQFYRVQSLYIKHSVIEYCLINNRQVLLMQMSVTVPNVMQNGTLFFEECYSVEMNGRPFWQVFYECRDSVEERGKARFKQKFNISIPDAVQFKLAERQYLEQYFSSK